MISSKGQKVLSQAKPVLQVEKGKEESDSTEMTVANKKRIRKHQEGLKGKVNFKTKSEARGQTLKCGTVWLLSVVSVWD